MLRALVEQAARMALALQPADPCFLHHADRGSQSTRLTYQELLARVRDRGEQEQLKRQLVQEPRLRLVVAPRESEQECCYAPLRFDWLRGNRSTATSTLRTLATSRIRTR